MKTETKVLAGILFFTVVLILGAVFLLTPKSTPSKQDIIVQIDYSKGQKIGSDSAKVKLVEFSDYQCPACAIAHLNLEKLRLNYPEDKLQLIYRHFPLPQHPNAKKAANLAEAAGEQGKFWEMSKRIFETQNQWVSLADATEFFISLAEEFKLDENEVRQALKEDKYQDKINADLAEGNSLGINATPTFFLNGHKLNLKSFKDLDTAVVEELKKD